MAELFSEVRKLSDDKLAQRLDSVTENLVPSKDYYYSEFKRRYEERAQQSISRMTLVITIATVANVIITAINVYLTNI